MIKYNPRAGAWYQNELYFSPAYQSLTNSARNLFHCMYNELKWKGAGQKREFTNNGEISLTEIQFKKMYNCCSSTYLTARNQLIEVGLITQTYRGGMCRGDMAKYKILALTYLSSKEQRWQQYPERNWESEIPKSKGMTVGKETRWKKGHSGRKVNSHPKKQKGKRENTP
jgi:hypothetical protein